MSQAPRLEAPKDGAWLNVGLLFPSAESAEVQADHWNTVLVNDPVMGPASGFVVGVGERVDGGRFPLVWRAVATLVDGDGDSPAEED